MGHTEVDAKQVTKAMDLIIRTMDMNQIPRFTAFAAMHLLLEEAKARKEITHIEIRSPKMKDMVEN